MADGRKENDFHGILENEMDKLAHRVYQITRSFPAEERYGVTSQIRRAALSVPLNYIEGYARQRSRSYRYFIEVSYGSLKETRYLLRFSRDEAFLSDDEYDEIDRHADKVGKMLWGILRKM